MAGERLQAPAADKMNRVILDEARSGLLGENVETGYWMKNINREPVRRATVGVSRQMARDGEAYTNIEVILDLDGGENVRVCAHSGMNEGLVAVVSGYGETYAVWQRTVGLVVGKWREGVDYDQVDEKDGVWVVGWAGYALVLAKHRNAILGERCSGSGRGEVRD